MSRVALVLIVFVAVAFSVEAQTPNLKGPRYKNAKPSEKYAGNRILLVKTDPGDLKGPEAKNDRRGKANRLEKKVYAEVDPEGGKNTKDLKGPRYKNYHPGRN